MGWEIIAVYVIAALAAGYSYYMAQKAGRNMSQATAGKFEVPTAEDGRPIPWLFGTREIKSMNVEWYGDGRTEPIQK